MHLDDSNMRRGDSDPNNPLYNEEKSRELRLEIRDIVARFANGDMSLNEADDLAGTIFNKIAQTW